MRKSRPGAGIKWRYQEAGKDSNFKKKREGHTKAKEVRAAGSRLKVWCFSFKFHFFVFRDQLVVGKILFEFVIKI